MDFDQLYPGRFLKAGDFKGKDVTLTITGVTIEKLPQNTGGERVRGILAFDKTEKQLVLNRTNGECIKAMFGRDTDKWIGKRLTLFPMDMGDSSFGDLAIRVRGSPDLAQDVSFELRLARKKPVTKTMERTGRNGKAAPAPKPAPEDDAKSDDANIPGFNADGT